MFSTGVQLVFMGKQNFLTKTSLEEKTFLQMVKPASQFGT